MEQEQAYRKQDRPSKPMYKLENIGQFARLKRENDGCKGMLYLNSMTSASSSLVNVDSGSVTNFRSSSPGESQFETSWLVLSIFFIFLQKEIN